MDVILLTKKETDEIKSKGLLVPSRIGEKVVHSHQARNLVKFISWEALGFIIALIFVFVFFKDRVKDVIVIYLGVALVLTIPYLAYCGISDVISTRKLKKIRGMVTSKTQWSKDDKDFWKRVSKKRGLKLEDYYRFEEVD